MITRPMNGDTQMFEDALKVARMYYHLNMTTAEIGKQLGIARPTVSRLLTWAKANGLVEFRVLDHRQRQLQLETRLEKTYGIREVKIVPAAPDTTTAERQDLVTSFAAHHLNSIIGLNFTVALAWGATVSLLAQKLIPKPLTGINIVQMNGSGNSGQGITYAAGIIAAFADNYNASANLLPIPAYFDNPSTKEAMFQERSIQRVRDLARSSEIAIFSIGVPDADSYIYQAGYVEEEELASLRREGVVGDIATVFFREDGTYQDLTLNHRSSGPVLSSLAEHQHSICIVAGEKKLQGVRAALRGGFMNTLIIDEPSASLLL